MGIKYLNRVLREQCKNAITPKHLWCLRNKKIAVDTYIYLYKFKGENALIENLYHMISLFKHYKITPIFIFDGKPPPEKYKEIENRKKIKLDAEDRYNKLKESLDNTNDIENQQQILNEMNEEKKNFIRITKSDLENVKELFDAYGVVYKTASGEADELCYKLVKRKIVYGCLSEDMDMFVYGCDRVFRYFSLINSTLIEYNQTKILSSLNLRQNEFREICVLAGTDYRKGCNIYKALTLFNKFKKSKYTGDFYKWLYKEKIIDDYQSLISCYLLFDLPNTNDSDVKKLQIVDKKVDKAKLRKILIENDFIFIN
jgi:5'-3' exonuclease